MDEDEEVVQYYLSITGTGIALQLLQMGYKYRPDFNGFVRLVTARLSQANEMVKCDIDLATVMASLQHQAIEEHHVQIASRSYDL